MKLWETDFKDDVINKKVQFLECEDPSTGRIYNIYPPSQNCKTAFEAKYNTFRDVIPTIRHGDVGIQLVGENILEPIMES